MVCSAQCIYRTNLFLQTMFNFFTRIDYLTLTPGNKSAGFFLAVSAKALEQLGSMTVSDEEWGTLVAEAHTRLQNAEILPKKMVADCGFERYQGTAVPRSFWVNRMFASSLGADPEWLRYVTDPEMSQVMGDEVSYSPHNVDAPKQALALMILVQTWSEWAWAKLAAVERGLGDRHVG